MKLFNVTIEGYVSYYVAAEEAIDCRRLIEETEADSLEGIFGVDDPEIAIEEVSMVDAAKKMIRSDDAPEGQERVPLYVCFEETKAPGVVACSEW